MLDIKETFRSRGKRVHKLNHKKIIIVILMFSSFLAHSQTSTIDFYWGATSGKLTRTTKLVNGQRILDGPLSYVGKDRSPSTMTVKTNYKNGLLNGSFSLNWVFPNDNDINFNAQGKFINDSLDGVWTFIVKGYDKGDQMNRKLTLTFKHGFLLQGDINNLLAKSQSKFNCDKTGKLHGNQIWKGYEDGYLIEEKTTYVHGIATSYSKKDLASGSYITPLKILCDTSIIKEKYYSSKFNYFSKLDETYELTNPKEKYSYLFNDDSFLGQFVIESYGGGFAPFIRTKNIILPKEFEVAIKKP